VDIAADSPKWAENDQEQWLAYWRAKTGSPTFGEPRRLFSDPIPADQVFYTLRARDLFDKGGFQDGDIFRDEFYDHVCRDKGIKWHIGRGEKYWYEDLLQDLITERLLPLVPFKLTLERVHTCHNQVRCFHVEGVPDDELDTFRDACEGVEVRVSWAEIRDFIDRKIEEGVLR